MKQWLEAMKQLTLGTVGFERYALTATGRLLAEMERVVPWSALIWSDRARLSEAG
jgi:hypothetical protein